MGGLLHGNESQTKLVTLAQEDKKKTVKLNKKCRHNRNCFIVKGGPGQRCHCRALGVHLATRHPETLPQPSRAPRVVRNMLATKCCGGASNFIPLALAMYLFSYRKTCH